MTFIRNNKSILIPESKKTDIYEAAGVSRRTNSQVEGAVGESTKQDPAGMGRMIGTEKKSRGHGFLFSFFFFLFLLFTLFYNLLKTKLDLTMPTNVERVYRQ